MSADRGRQLHAQLAELCARLGRRVQVMEVCGTHTVAIFRSGIRALLPENLRLVSGPGCPVCVTAQRHIDAAIDLAARPDVVIATYGDMMRVPGRRGSLEKLRAVGARVRVVNSARRALQVAQEHPADSVVFLAVGFETTAPATAATLLEAAESDVKNFAVLMAHKLVVPAMLALLEAGDVPLDGFLCPGHVSVIIGSEAYRPVVERHQRACVVAGFEPEPIMRGLVALVRQLVEGRAELENAYSAAVQPVGNRVALELLERVFTPADTPWRELGVIPQSGLELRPAYQRFDALARFGLELGQDEDHPGCRCGDVIQGKAEPADCPLFGQPCTPLDPIGPCMVSSEGTCAAWYKYHLPAVDRTASDTQSVQP
ncbi:MAG: hydrogenase formation protein HypD [Planctomycetes bacterium]|nr:hydrogenase formation protein HypD [Planctomycetota bacterium]